jgi:hypothetical protein
MLRRIFVKEGFAGIYAGIYPTLVMGVPNTVLYFVMYEELREKKQWRQQQQQQQQQQQELAILMIQVVQVVKIGGGFQRLPVVPPGH